MRRWMMLVFVVAACGSAGRIDATATTTPATTTPNTTTSTSVVIPSQLEGFEVSVVTIDGRPMRVAVADTRPLRRKGLMFVEDLKDLDGMIFVFDAPTTTRFWMKNTLIPLDIAFFDAHGVLVSVATMAPCTGDSCQYYRADGTYLYSVEVPVGGFSDLADGAVLDVSGLTD